MPKTIVITGGNAGVGYALAQNLMADSSGPQLHIILACRDGAKANAAIESLKSTYPTSPNRLEFFPINLGNLASIQQFAILFAQKYNTLDVLFNNAGVIPKERTMTNDGFELTVQTNHVGPTLLTALMLPLLKRTPGSRIVFVASELHGEYAGGRPNFDLENMDGSKSWDATQFYRNSKLFNVFTTYKYAALLESSKIVVVTLTPGWIPYTDLARESSFIRRIMMKYVVPLLPFTRTLEQGAEVYKKAAFSPEFDGAFGKQLYLDNTGALVPSSEESRDDAKIDALWKWTWDMLYTKGYTSGL